MHRSSDTIGTFPRPCQSPDGADQSREIARCHHPVPLSSRSRPHLPLCPAVERLGYCPQEPWPARDRDYSDHGIDKEAGLLRLTTILAHSSGEWISSEWPVCQITDIASAQRMGAALTYARRYALFTLVGIAGEDDLDAPDLGADPNPAAEPSRPRISASNRMGKLRQRNGQLDGKLPGPSARSVLGVQLSASLRESLIEQLAARSSADEATAWAHRSLPAKNTLTAADAKMVEERFR